MNRTAFSIVNSRVAFLAGGPGGAEAVPAGGRPDPGALLRQAQGGDAEAFAAVFETHRPLLYRIACRIVGADDADDVVMDTYLKAWRSIPSFRGAASLRTWLCRAVRNTALDRLRWRARRPASSPEPGGDDGGVGIEGVADSRERAPDRQAITEETGRAVAAAVAELSQEHRLALLLREVDGLSYREVAAATGSNVGTVMSRLFYARRRVRRILEAQGVTP
ncbi:MAG: ECF RNA polymerase sigma-E factor [Lentisphaerae bacterium ADurb.BinA184]|nr:MAG: ECF RNA polymerase sigma-E factor [Lentisphaerae bacterium ADurb.BinA184]